MSQTAARKQTGTVNDVIGGKNAQSGEACPGPFRRLNVKADPSRTSFSKPPKSKPTATSSQPRKSRPEKKSIVCHAETLQDCEKCQAWSYCMRCRTLPVWRVKQSVMNNFIRPYYYIKYIIINRIACSKLYRFTLSLFRILSWTVDKLFRLSGELLYLTLKTYLRVVRKEMFI